jgi:two-component system, chemotaxis family, protein-glutamate methylesterase/glutaminase
MDAKALTNSTSDVVWFSGSSGSWSVDLSRGGVFASVHGGGEFMAVSVAQFDRAAEVIEELLTRASSIGRDLRIVASPLNLGMLGSALQEKGITIGKRVTRVGPFTVKFDKGHGRIQISREERNEVFNEGRGSRDHFGGRKIRVLIVDDSEVIGSLLKKVIESDAQMTVVGICANPLKADEMVAELKPDLLTMDIYMPEMDGVELVRRLYPKYKTPIVMISSVSKEEGPMVLEALDHGAFDYIQKPSLKPISELREMIIPRLKTAAASVPPSLLRNDIPPPKVQGPWKKDFVVAIGSSTGGTEALKRLFQAFPDTVPPTVVAQHIPPVFSDALAKRLNSYVKFEVREAKTGDILKPNLVLIAPGGSDMRIVRSSQGLTVEVLGPHDQYRHHPSVDFLFESVAEHCGEKAVGVILTGMGSDGALGMKSMKAAGGWNIAQDESSCVVYGMPKEAVAKGGVDEVAHLDDIADVMDRKLK